VCEGVEMTVYVVYSLFYTDYYIDKVFASLKKAKQFVAAQGEYKWHYHIKTMDVQ